MKRCTDAEMREAFQAHHIPFGVLGERFTAICELLEEDAPEGATELDVCLKAGFYLDDRGSLEWEDDDVCTDKAQAATKPREWFAVLDRDGYGDVYPDKASAERDAATYNERIREYAPYRVAHLREVAA